MAQFKNPRHTIKAGDVALDLLQKTATPDRRVIDHAEMSNDDYHATPAGFTVRSSDGQHWRVIVSAAGGVIDPPEEAQGRRNRAAFIDPKLSPPVVELRHPQITADLELISMHVWPTTMSGVVPSSGYRKLVVRFPGSRASHEITPTHEWWPYLTLVQTAHERDTESRAP